MYLFISLLYLFRATQPTSSGETIDSPDDEQWVARNK